MKYRADIDGLRALAVLLVIFNHYGFGLSGGYVGVDVFFVISGFVITIGIYPRIKANNFTYSQFWYARIRRLMPALFLVLFISSLIFSIILVPSDLLLFSKNLLAANFSLSNFYIWSEYGGYFSGNAQEAPLLHTWSLAVEEQFYILWPICLVLLCKLFSGPRLLLVLICSTVAFIFVSQYGVERTIAAAYYLLPTRVFELLLGCSVAIYLSEFKHPKQKETNLKI